MKLCFLIYSYFPFGGQQRDFLRLIQEALDRDHDVCVFAFKWEGEVPEGADLTLVPIKGYTRLQQYRNYTGFVEQYLEQRKELLVIGFNKMPLLDIYYAADLCFLEKAETQRGSYYRFTPRYRHFSDYEDAVFGAFSNTLVLLLSDLQRRSYLKHYPQCSERLFELPPGVSRDRKVERRDCRLREELRSELQVENEELLILQVGSGFRVKGVDRSLKALASLPPDLKRRCRFVLIGQDRATRFRWQARRLGLSDKVSFLDGRSDIIRFFFAADMLLHPAYEESAGYVLLEAAIAGLPVLTTATCGYAVHIQRAGAGEVCPEPFSQNDLNSRLAMMLKKLPDADWSANGLELGQRPELYSMPQLALDRIEKAAREKQSSWELAP